MHGRPTSKRLPHDMAALFAERERDRYVMHADHLNEHMVRVLKTIGYDVGFTREAVLRCYLLGKDGRQDMVMFGLLASDHRS